MCIRDSCFETCFSLQQSTISSNLLSLFATDQQSNQFLHRFWIQSTFFCKNLDQCSNCCLNTCFLFVQCAREAASPGASRHWNRWLFDFGEALFFWPIFWRTLFIQNCDFGIKLHPKWTQNENSRKLFFRKSAKLKKCVWTAPAWTDCIWARPVESSGRPKNRRKKRTYFRTPLFWAKLPKGVQKGEAESRVAPLGAVLRHVWCPKPFFDYKNEPIALPKCLQEPKITQKMTPEVDKWLEKLSKKGPAFRIVFF